MADLTVCTDVQAQGYKQPTPAQGVSLAVLISQVKNYVPCMYYYNYGS